MFHVKTFILVCLNRACKIFENWSTDKVLKSKVSSRGLPSEAYISRVTDHLGPVVQNFVSLTLSLSPKFVSYIRGPAGPEH